VDIPDAVADYDPEFSFRRPTGIWPRIITTICVIWSLGQLYTAGFGIFPSTLQRAPHVGFALILIFLLYPAKWGRKTNSIPWYDYCFVALSALVSLYHVYYYEDLIHRTGNYNNLDVWISAVALLVIIEAAWRIAGPVITSLGFLFLFYAYFGPDLPGFLAHPGFSADRIVTFQWLSTEGILGIPIDVSSTFIFLFMIFAAFLKKSGIGDWMTNVAVGLTGGAVGGPAKAAVISSACQGTISGSSVANVVGTGSVTIPLMKSIGYRREFAGAVEAAASTGGQLMPPIMGAAAFIMTEFLNIPYYKIALGAAIPALLYFAGIFITVHLEAKRTGLLGIPKAQLPNWKQLLRERWFLALPLAGIVAMLTAGFTPMLAALIGIGIIIAVSYIRQDTRLSLTDIIFGLEEGARSALPVVAACATAGIIVGIITLTGLGLKLGGGIVDLAGGNVYLTLFFTMIGSLILGMGIPTTANYIIQATVSAPALVQVGIHPLAAHLFVFYFGIVADITPPVALAAFAGAGVAKSDPFKTGFEAFKLGAAAYLVPYIFALSPVLILVNVTHLAVAKALITALIGMFGISAATTGFFVTHCRWWQRILLFTAGVCLIDPGTVTDAAGLIVIALIYTFQRLQNRSTKEQTTIA
jgi:TRAP transporter 4TM/12TM fusion protein